MYSDASQIQNTFKTNNMESWPQNQHTFDSEVSPAKGDPVIYHG